VANAEEGGACADRSGLKRGHPSCVKHTPHESNHKQAVVDQLVQQVLEDPCVITNPRAPTAEELRQLLVAAWSTPGAADARAE